MPLKQTISANDVQYIPHFSEGLSQTFNITGLIYLLTEKIDRNTYSLPGKRATIMLNSQSTRMDILKYEMSIYTTLRSYTAIFIFLKQYGIKTFSLDVSTAYTKILDRPFYTDNVKQSLGPVPI